MAERGLRILSLDGGGVSALSELLIIKEHMFRVQRATKSKKNPRPCDWFDLIGGTGVGGLIAILLGRLDLDVDEAIKCWDRVMSTVFSKRNKDPQGPAFSGTRLAKVMGEIVKERFGTEKEFEKMMGSENPNCKVVVYAVTSDSVRGGLVISMRSYRVDENQGPECTIVEAVRATMATPGIFRPKTIGSGIQARSYMGGSLVCNNPTELLLEEAQVAWRARDQAIASVISVGSGQLLPTSLLSLAKLGSALNEIAQSCEKINQEMDKKFEGVEGYYRFNVEQGMQCIDQHSPKQIKEAGAHTDNYLRDVHTNRRVSAAVRTIINNIPRARIQGKNVFSYTNQTPAATVVAHNREEQLDTRLDLLSPAKDAWYDSDLSASMTKRGECTANTRMEVLADAHTWTRDDKEAKIYWMNGMAGTGKTTIAYSLCKQLEKHNQLGASFFCSRDSPTCRDVARLVPTIAYQLGRHSKSYLQAVCDVVDEDPDVVNKNIEAQFEKLIAKPLRKAKTVMPTDVVAVIDALDELDDVNGTELEQILNLLFQHAKELPIKFFVTSRPEDSILKKMELESEAARSILHLHDIEQSIVQADIRTYLNKSLESIHASDDDLKALTSLAGCLFIFAATAVRYITPEHGRANHKLRLREILKATATGNGKKNGRRYDQLDALYTTILSTAFDDSILEEEELELQHLVLRTVVCAREPSTAATLAELLGLPDEDEVLWAIQSLRSVLHVSEGSGVISTLHASFPDFLLSEERSKRFHCGEAQHNEYLSTRCFAVMKQSLRFNICGLETSYRFDKDVPNLQTRIDSAITSGLFYACRFWVDHLHGAATPSILGPHLYEFLRDRLLFWMEVLNLKGWINRAEGILFKVHSWLLTDNTSTKLREFTYDARNFVTTFAANPTSLSTPHIYLSVLPFTSNQSHVRANYWPRTRGLLRVEGTGMEARGGTALATWNVGSRVQSIAQSGDGKRIVSRCEDGTVSIWDISKGARIVGPLKSDERGWLAVRGVAFSFDGTRIASSSWNYTIRICDAHNGNLITNTLTGHTKGVTSVAFSPDGTRLISGSFDRTIRMWDARNGSQGNPFQGHQGPVLSVAFSADGKRIASGSDDHTIRIWDVRSATTILGPLKGHTDSVSSVAFSPDGRRVVSGSKDKTVRVWDVQSGTILADPFRGHTYRVMSVAFSPDGTRVVSGAMDDTIRIWNAQSGVLIARLKGHRQTVNSVLFSADGTRIFSGSDDRTICVWDARHGTTAPAEPSGHTEAISSVAFSPGGTRVVSGSRDRTIRVWDTRNGRLAVGPLEGHTNDVSSVAFSPDGAQIVSGSYDRTIRTWDARSGATIADPFEGHTKWVQWVAYSPDGRCIASASTDATIRLWDSQTGKPVAEPIMGHTNSVESVAWSPDATRIVSGSYDGTVRMWNTHGTALWTSDAHTNEVHCVAYSPDGARIVSGSNAILVLNADDGTLLHGPFKGHSDRIWSVAFSPDGTRIVSGSSNTVCVWDAQNDTLVSGPLKGHTKTVRSVAFSPDSRRVVSCSFDKTIRFWDVATADKPLPAYLEHSTLRDDGWVTDSDSQLFMWLPPDLRDAISPPYSGIIRPEGAIFANYHDLLVGERWMECYRDSTTRTMA